MKLKSKWAASEYKFNLSFFAAGITSAAILFLPTLILIQQTLEHLFIEHTYLFDIGFWVGLSTRVNPLLLEPSVLNPEYSYFNTHFSPVFIGIQIAYKVLGENNPPLFFAHWFSSLGILPIFIATVTTLFKIFSTAKSSLLKKIILLFSVTVVVWGYINSNTWQNSFIGYLHVEPIGMQLVGAGWLLLAIEEINIKDKHAKKRWVNVLGLILILVGAMFHELIGIFAIL